MMGLNYNNNPIEERHNHSWYTYYHCYYHRYQLRGSCCVANQSNQSMHRIWTGGELIKTHCCGLVGSPYIDFELIFCTLNAIMNLTRVHFFKSFFNDLMTTLMKRGLLSHPTRKSSGP